MKLDGKAVNLPQLAAELAAAGIAVPALGTAGDDLHAYDEDGVAIDLPTEAAAMVAAHVPEPPPNGWSIIRSLIPYSEGPEDVLVLLDMQAALMGGADPED